MNGSPAAIALIAAGIAVVAGGAWLLASNPQLGFAVLGVLATGCALVSVLTNGG